MWGFRLLQLWILVSHYTDTPIYHPTLSHWHYSLQGRVFDFSQHPSFQGPDDPYVLSYHFRNPLCAPSTDVLIRCIVFLLRCSVAHTGTLWPSHVTWSPVTGLHLHVSTYNFMSKDRSGCSPDTVKPWWTSLRLFMILGHAFVCQIYGLLLSTRLEDELLCSCRCTCILAFLTLYPRISSVCGGL